jgi:hypothetical protein
MKQKQNPETLSSTSRWLTYLVAALYTLLGLPLFLAPGWAAQNFLWNASPFVVMTIGGWYLGAAFVAWLCARNWRWSLIYIGMVFVWAFSLLEMGLITAYWSTLRLDGPLAWSYLFVLAVGSIISILGIVDWMRSRPSTEGKGPQPPVWQRILLYSFIGFALYISVPLLFGTATGGKIWPGELSPLTARGFGAFYLAITLADLVGVAERRLTTFQFVIPFAGVGSALMLIPALAYLHLFDFRAQPGGLVYIGTYVVALFVTLVALLTNRSLHNLQTAGGATS